MPLRLYMVPVAPRRWVLCCKEMFMDQGKAHARSWREGKSVKEKAELLVRSSVHSAKEQLHEFEKAPAVSWKGKAYGLVRRLMNRIDPMEKLLMSVPADTRHFQIIAPSGCNPHAVRRRMLTLLSERPTYHRRLFVGSAALTPFTSTIFTLLPGPNVVFMWNAFRAYSHYQSLAGCYRLCAANRPNPPDHHHEHQQHTVDTSNHLHTHGKLDSSADPFPSTSSSSADPHPPTHHRAAPLTSHTQNPPIPPFNSLPLSQRIFQAVPPPEHIPVALNVELEERVRPAFKTRALSEEELWGVVGHFNLGGKQAVEYLQRFQGGKKWSKWGKKKRKAVVGVGRVKRAGDVERGSGEEGRKKEEEHGEGDSDDESDSDSDEEEEEERRRKEAGKGKK